MSWEPPQGSFIVQPVQPHTGFIPWPKAAQELPKPIVPAWHNDEELKRRFGIELAKHKPFEAGLAVFGDDTNSALWASFNWLADPLVVATRDNYTQNIELSEKLLDKDAFAAKMLKLADEKDISGRFYILEGKDRLAAYKLFAEVQGFIGKLSIDASTNTFTNNELKITLVKPEKQEQIAPTVIEQEPEIVALPLNLKLVGSR